MLMLLRMLRARTAAFACFALLSATLAGCAAETARRDAARPATEQEQAEAPKQALPTFTYRPGS